jgi:glycosyltransferase involved in cell wall biosynthesis
MSPMEARQELGFAPQRRLIGAVGRLSEEKGFDLLIDAVGRLHQAGLEVDLAIAGEGNARGDLERLIAAQPHPERFHLLGFRSELHTFYQALDIFALSSRREGLPNVLLEAMSLETPVVGTAVAGVPRLIKDGSTGRLIPPNDVAALQQALQILLLDDNLRERLAAQAREDVVARYDFSVRMQKVRAVYDGLHA